MCSLISDAMSFSMTTWNKKWNCSVYVKNSIGLIKVFKYSSSSTTRSRFAWISFSVLNLLITRLINSTTSYCTYLLNSYSQPFVPKSNLFAFLCIAIKNSMHSSYLRSIRSRSAISFQLQYTYTPKFYFSFCTK